MDTSSLSSAGFPVPIQALLGLQAPPTEAQVKAALAALVGQDLNLLFLGATPEGKTFRTPTGALLVAQGDFPYPEGTTVTVRVQPPAPAEAAPRLVPLTVQPPAPPAVLAPLVQGEAAPLLARLLLPEPPPALAPLAALFRALEAPPEAPTPAAPEAEEAGPPLPPALREALARVAAQEAPPEPLPAQLARWRPEAPLPEALPAPVRQALVAAQQDPGVAQSWPPALRQQVAQALTRLLPPEPPEARTARWLAAPALPPEVEARVASLPPAEQAQVRGVLAQVAGSLAESTSPAPPVAAESPASLGAPAPAPTSMAQAAPTPPASAPPAAAPLAAPAASQPSMQALVRALERLPTPLRTELGQALGLTFPEGRPPSPPALAQALRAPLPAPTTPSGSTPRTPVPEGPPPPPAVAPEAWAALPAPLRERLAPLLTAAPPTPESATPPSQPQTTGPLPTDAPPPEAMLRLLTALPQPLQGLLQRLGPTPPNGAPPQDWAEALVRWMRQATPAPSQPGADKVPPALARFLAANPAPPSAEEALARALRAPLPEPGATPPSRPGPAQAPAAPAAAPPPRGLPLAPELVARLSARLEAPAPALAAHPEPWEAWVEASLRTLSDPAASPREAPFHALQGLDRTAAFEVPLPWSPQHPLQVWAETDETPPPPGEPPTHRVLLGLHFTRLGETRVGLERTGAALAVRIWAEHSDALAATETAIRKDLAALGLQVSVQIRALPHASPGPRSYAAGSGWGGMG